MILRNKRLKYNSTIGNVYCLEPNCYNSTKFTEKHKKNYLMETIMESQLS